MKKWRPVDEAKPNIEPGDLITDGEDVATVSRWNPPNDYEAFIRPRWWGDAIQGVAETLQTAPAPTSPNSAPR